MYKEQPENGPAGMQVSSSWSEKQQDQVATTQASAARLEEDPGFRQLVGRGKVEEFWLNLGGQCPITLNLNLRFQTPLDIALPNVAFCYQESTTIADLQWVWYSYAGGAMFTRKVALIIHNLIMQWLTIA